MTGADLTVIVPAHQEEARIGACLESLCNQRLPEGARPELLVVPNGCTDGTARLTAAWRDAFEAAGWTMRVLERPQGGKIAAINAADAEASGAGRLYLDADIVMGEGMMAALYAALAAPGARFVGAVLRVPRPRSRVSRAYARFWQRLPFVADGVTGAGLFAVNAAGRARWDAFPDIIADDAFARLHFSAAERVRIDIPYLWPITEGLVPLVRVRRRQDAGNAQINRLFPHLAVNGDADHPSAGRILQGFLSDPVGFAVYAGVSLAVRLRRPSGKWDRGR